MCRYFIHDDHTHNNKTLKNNAECMTLYLILNTQIVRKKIITYVY